MTKKKAATQYPKYVYYDREHESHGRFNTYTEPNDMVIHGEAVEVGVYEFKGMVQIVNATTVEPIPPAKKAAKKRRK